MPDTPITPILGEITEMQAAFKQPSCNSKLPFVEYPSVGTPPVLSFNVPQNTAFVTYGHFLKYLPETYFKAFTKKIPENNYFNTIRNMNAQQAAELFHPIPPSLDYSVPGGSYIGGVFYPTAGGSSAGGAAGGGIPLAGHAPIDESKPVPTNGTEGATAPTSASPSILNKNYKYIPYNGDVMIATPAAPNKVDLKADYAANNLRPYDINRLNGLGKVTKYVAEPPQPTPRIIILEEYTTVSYLGNYGAGKIVKTFSLYPGERTTISLRTYKDRVSTVESSKNVLDSFSDSSATALDTLMQEEQGNIEATSSTSGGSGNSFTTNTDSRNSNKSFGIKGGLNLGFLSIGGGYGKSMGETSTSTGGMSSTYNYNQTASRMSNMNTLSSALNKHVQQSNAVRQVDVNTTTTDTQRSGEESVTVRELQNVNLNNVLNITYRQMLQEYTVLTYLSNVRFAYTNGYPESYTVVDLSDLPNMLLDIIDTTTNPLAIDEVLCQLLTPYCSVMDYLGVGHQFVEKVPIPNADCLNLSCAPPANEDLFRIPPTLEMIYNDGVVDATIHGVILKVQKQTLQTSSLITDALLGRGDALDCFNQNAQNAANMTAYTNALQQMQRLTDSVQTTANNQLFATQQLTLGDKQVELAEKKVDVVTQQMDLVTGITDPLDKATHYKKVFGECCDVPQSCCGGGCGCDCAETPPAP
jgi:hypothetical protein